MTENLAPQSATSSGLRRNSIGTFGLIFMVIAAAAPLTAMASNISLSLGFGAGPGTVGLLLVVAAILIVFASAYVALARHITDAGAYYAFIGFGLGSSAGAGAAFVAATAYNLAAGGMAAATGYFANLTMASVFGVDVGWYVYAAVTLAATAVLGRRGVDVTKYLTAGASVLQFVILIWLALAVAVQRPRNWSLDVFSPSAMLDGNVALTLAFCIVSFVGFESTAIYGEEAKSARRSIRIATFTSIALLVGVFVAATWSLVAAFDDVRATAGADPGALVFRAADVYLGGWSGTALSGLVTVSFFAASIAFHNMAARYHFSLGRAGLLPRALQRVHPRWKAPSVASATQVGISIVMLIPFVITRADPIVNLFPIVSGVTSLSLTTLMIGCCLSILVAGHRGKLPPNRWAVVIAPAAAGLGMAFLCTVILFHYTEVTGSSQLIVAMMPLVPLVLAAYGALRQRAIGSARSPEPEPSPSSRALMTEGVDNL